MDSLGPDDPDAPKNPWNLMPQDTSPYPWRLANDADFDITGHKCPQGEYRSIVWGNGKTKLYSMHPDTFGKREVVSMWGFPYVRAEWNYAGYEGRPVELVVFSAAEEVEILINGRSLGRRALCIDRPMPCSVRFETVYESGEVTAVSYSGGKEISRDSLHTTGKAEKIRIAAEKDKMRADGHDLIFVNIEIVDADGNIVPDADTELNAAASGVGLAAGFGSAAPVTEEDYTDNKAHTYRGRAMLVLRSGYEKGKCVLSVKAEGFAEAKAEFVCE